MATVGNVDNNDNDNKTDQKSRPAHPSLTPESTFIIDKGNPDPPPSTFTAKRIQTSTFASTTSPILSLERQHVNQETALSRDAQQTIECCADYHQWDGYNHSKVIKTSPVASATHEIAPWLKDISQRKILQFPRPNFPQNIQNLSEFSAPSPCYRRPGLIPGLL
jgi:hypothetical protein